MIFVTVGMHFQSFERLIKKMDEIAGKISDEIFMQIGYTKYIPKNAKYIDFLNDDQMMNYYRDARILVCHAGSGTLLTGLKLGKPIIVVPRLKKFGEHIDDQQLDLAEALASSGKAIPAYDIDTLEELLINIDKKKFSPVLEDKRLINFLKEYVEDHNK